MLYRITTPAAAAALLLAVAPLRAGGPPRLHLPLDGVTDRNRAACADRLTESLDRFLWKHAGRPAGVRIQAHRGQAYMTCYLNGDIGLSDVEAALKGTAASVAKGKLRLFGHAVLVIDSAGPEKRWAEIPHVSVVETARHGGKAHVTVDMPYGEPFADDLFGRCDFSLDQSKRGEVPVSVAKLPKITDFRGAEVKDVRWRAEWGCRSLGGVTR